MTPTKPQREVKSPGAATPQVVEPGVTYAFNLVLDKAGSTAVAQFHLPLNMDESSMRAYTDKALHVVEMVQLKFDRDKLKVEIKLSAMMIDRQKEELKQARIARDEEAKRSGSGKVAKPVTQQLLSIDNSVKQSMARHEAMLLDLAQMEKRLGSDSSPNN